jgi:hypothetical protein
MLIWSPKQSPRLKYVFTVLLKEILQYQPPLVFTTNEATFLEAVGAKLQYGGELLVRENSIYVAAHGLLWEENIRAPFAPDLNTWQGQPSFFQTAGGMFSFDMAAAAFFLLSRYEEYWPHTPDAHGRFRAEDSWAFQHDFLNVPLVDIWAQHFKKAILSVFPETVFAQKKYQFLPTFDIDNAFAFKHKGLKRTLLASAADLLYGRWKNHGNRCLTLVGLRPDVYDTYETLHQLHEKLFTKPVIFWLLGDYAPFDKNLSHENSAFRQLIQEMAARYEVGIHPSYASFGKEAQMLIEKQRLEQISGKAIKISRQHYLRMKLPETYQLLVNCGIETDYSIGYGSQIGFRASTSHQFSWYDLSTEKMTTLKIQPFAVMDATLRHYLKLSPEEAIAQTQPLIEAVKATDGIFCSLLHNEILSDVGEWDGWLSFYQKLIKLAE